MKYIIPLAVMAATGAGIYYIESYAGDFACALVFCGAGFFFGKNVAQYFSLKKKSR